MELFRRLAKTMGFDDGYWERTDEEMLIDFHDWDSPAMEGITWDKLTEHGYMRINVGSPDVRAPHAEGNFPTPSGKCEFKSSLAEGGNFVVPVRVARHEPGAGQAIPAQYRLTETARVSQQPVRQRARQAARPGRAMHFLAPRRRG
ncbi:MAG: hypothetical protein ACRDRG_09345 [Pseudonocardiaceae bacterium]